MKRNHWLLALPLVVLGLLGCRLLQPAPVPARATATVVVELSPTAAELIQDAVRTPSALPTATSETNPAPSATADPSQDAARPAPVFVRLEPAQGELGKLLAEQAAIAHEKGLSPFVEFDATWCINCKELDASLSDPRMIQAFAGVYIIRVDIDAWKSSLVKAGFLVPGVPAFYEIDAQGKSTGRMITGGAWDDNIPENMAGPLGDFFAGK
jgi:hypothetical protein